MHAPKCCVAIRVRLGASCRSGARAPVPVAVSLCVTRRVTRCVTRGVTRGMARALTKFLLYRLSTPQLMGGVRKWTPERLDLLIRDAACAASARALNAFNNAGPCPDSAEADIRQIRNLINQSRRSSAKAIADGDLTPSDWTTLEGYLTLAEGNLSPALLDAASAQLQQACDFFAD